jgi:hypothetical protein
VAEAVGEEDAEAAAASEILMWGRMWKTRDLRRLLKVDLLVYKSQCLFLHECDNAQKKVAAAAMNPATPAAGDTKPSPEALSASMDLVSEALTLADSIEAFPTLIAARYQLAMMQLTADQVPACLSTMETVESVPTPIVRFRALAAEVYFDVARRVRVRVRACLFVYLLVSSCLFAYLLVYLRARVRARFTSSSPLSVSQPSALLRSSLAPVASAKRKQAHEESDQQKYLDMSVTLNEQVIAEDANCAPAYEMLALCRKLKLVAKHQAKFEEEGRKRQMGQAAGAQFNADEYLAELELVVEQLDKAIEVDPNLHTAYQHKVEILQERLHHDFMWGKSNENVLEQYVSWRLVFAAWR